MIAPLSFSTLAFFLLALFFSWDGLFPVGSGICAWLCAIQCLNAFIPQKPWASPIRWLYAMSFEIPAALGVPLWRLFPARDQESGEGAPILLVHGYLNHNSIWLWFEKRLKKHYSGPIYTIRLRHPLRSIREYAKQVEEKVQQIVKETGRKDLILIGHSMGGLVSSLYAPRDPSVKKVITIGSPLHGTPMAYLGIGPNAKEMRPSSELLQEIREGMRKSSTRFFHIATRCDQLVIPGDSAMLKENEHVVFEDLGHVSLIYSKRVAAQVAEWIKK